MPSDLTDALDAHWRPRKPRTYYRVRDGATVVSEAFSARYVTFRRDPEGELMRMGREAFMRAYAEDPPTDHNVPPPPQSARDSSPRYPNGR